MSKNPDGLPNDKNSAWRYLLWLSSLDGVTAVYIKGSRSPKNPKQSHEQSDWDIEVVTDKKIIIADPRKIGVLLADVVFVDQPHSQAIPFLEIF